MNLAMNHVTNSGNFSRTTQRASLPHLAQRKLASLCAWFLVLWIGLASTGWAGAADAQPTMEEAAASASAQRAEGHPAQEAFRRGQYDLAITLWEDRLAALGEPGVPSAERGHLCYNIANAHYRSDRPMQAIAWYEAALRHLPRDGDVRANLNFVRSELGLPPAQGDGLGATVGRWVSAWTPAEARRLALLAVLLLAVVLTFEALRGGTWGKRLAWIGAFAAVLLSLPWMRSLWTVSEPTSIVVAERGVTGRSEPRTTARSLASLKAAERVRPVDAWQDWVKVQTSDGKEVWVAEEKVLSTWR